MYPLLLLAFFISTTVFATNPPQYRNQSFGVNGQSGWSGQNGTDGMAGPSISINATGEFADYNIQGKDGTDGTHGTNGTHASNCVHPFRPNYNLYGARGGDGGFGGDGGAGGNGGHATVYFQDERDLKNIRIDASGGSGGRAGIGGSGGDACRCQDNSWLLHECWWELQPEGTYAQRCEYRRYYCYDGRTGYFGSHGISRGDGTLGSVSLIQKNSPLEQDNLSTSFYISQIPDAKPLLAYNRWSHQNGALALFAPGSRISDKFKRFDGRAIFPVNFVWANRRSPSLFSQDKIYLHLQDNRVVSHFSKGVWAQVDTHLDASQVSTLSIAKIVHESEVANLEIYFSGTNQNTTLVIKDRSEVSDMLNTDVFMHLEADTLFNKDLFKGVVPERFIRVSKDRVEIDVGKMDIKQKYLNPGETLLLDMKLGRSLGDKKVQLEVEIEQVLKP